MDSVQRLTVNYLQYQIFVYSPLQADNSHIIIKLT